MSGGRPREPLAQRFWLHVDQRQRSECWPWTASLFPNGYGRLSRGGKDGFFLAHRVAWELANDAQPGPLLVCHTCDNRRCVNPDHLRLGTHTDNMRDMADKGRAGPQQKSHCKNGHEFSPENTHIRISRYGPSRVCLVCRRASSRLTKLRAKARRRGDAK